jgi:NAD(P)-dependent dehydrogenase (short-subunit alcohol dehydrogenase family)
MSTPSPAPAVVITGASTGIGEACSLELDRRGFRVFAGVRSEAAARKLRSLASSCLFPLQIDVTVAESVAAAARLVTETVGEAGLAGLVNNAGIVVAAPLELVPLDELRRQLEVNVVGQVAVTQAFLPLLRKAKGRIVNMGSFNGRVAAPYLGCYAASKHAMEALSDALRIELRSWGIDVALIEPGSTSTPIWEKSLAAANRLAETVTSDGLALYDADMAALRKATQRLAGTAGSVAGVVQAVVHALTARRPKTRYPVGIQTHLIFRAHKWVPDRIWDWIIERQLGLT